MFNRTHERAGFSNSVPAMSLLCALVPGVLLLASHLMTESPVWLIAQDRRTEADEIATRLGGGHYLTEEEACTFQGATILELRRHRRATIIALGKIVTMLKERKRKNRNYQ